MNEKQLALPDTGSFPCPDPRDYNLELPSSLIEFGIAAMKWWESLPNAEIDMNFYREKSASGDICFACCGGAARCAINGWTPENFDVAGVVEQISMEDQLDAARCGTVGNMLELMEVANESEKYEIFYDRYITPYRERPEQFYLDMQQLADDLKEGGY